MAVIANSLGGTSAGRNCPETGYLLVTVCGVTVCTVLCEYNAAYAARDAKRASPELLGCSPRFILINHPIENNKHNLSLRAHASGAL